MGLNLAREGVLGEEIVYEVVLDSAGDGRNSGGLRSGDARPGKYANSQGDSPASSDFNSRDINLHGDEPVILDPNRSAAYFPLIRDTRGEC